ncbi:MAG: hypothetical protein C4533_03790 [Candidatus Omnitrophota bacterium]|jgi:chromosome segregation protein|nr:MAG: hypothetical protein C4533_03790 [Candidatus Omnitrophota bacterium]
MYLKRLEILGFKSFLNKTVLQFEPGITAVVGPNGCGKSNIFDSMRWVLGEQSVKSLRGSDMVDVIFNGTDAKEPLSMAEVSLAFDNKGRYFAVDSEEVLITRRIFRSGECEYLLNKTQVRLKDILELLMGTGIGAESYSLVEQGKIDLLLSSKPEDRRLVFDEASGITKYKSQKREALRKLEETQQNLLRVNDIIVEVNRQISSLERQANKARKYKEAFEELKLKEFKLASSHIKGLLTEKDDIRNNVAQLTAKEAELSAAICQDEENISGRQVELAGIEDSLRKIKDIILDLNNQDFRANEKVNFNKEKIQELELTKIYLSKQLTQVKEKLSFDEEKFMKVKNEFDSLSSDISQKNTYIRSKEDELSQLNLSVRSSVDAIANAKKHILELMSKISSAKNQITDLISQEQVFLARKKRLQVENAKITEEKSLIEESLNLVTSELSAMESNFASINEKIQQLKSERQSQAGELTGLESEIDSFEKQLLSLESQREFLINLKHRYEDIGESMEAEIKIDRLPADILNGLVVRIKSYDKDNLRLTGEAKPIDLDAQRVEQLIDSVNKKLQELRLVKEKKELIIKELEASLAAVQEELRTVEINLANKKAYHETVSAQFSKLKEEEEVITIELNDLGKELSVITGKVMAISQQQKELEDNNKAQESLIIKEQNNITFTNEQKEGVLISIAEAKTQLQALLEKKDSEEETVMMLKKTYEQDRDVVMSIDTQLQDASKKQEALNSEISGLRISSEALAKEIVVKQEMLKENEARFRELSEGTSETVKMIESNRKEAEAVKARIYEIQMQEKDLDFQCQSIKDRILQAYKLDLGAEQETHSEDTIDENVLTQEIEKLKNRVDSYGSVNLVAIEEYDELKKRYDFLVQQQNDLVSSKESLHEAILKINRTTKKMFLETFEKVREEFRSYFRLLFNGGDGQIFLIDEQDPLESGIEIVCRPPGKKLQNVLLLSGGEKSMSAIALMFAIFKVKPAPFCVLDEIDAALDEANVDRFGRILQDFTETSQFIVITHNKKTIANADVMYGITMEESGVSKIVSVKFSQNKGIKDKQADLVPA